MSIDFVKSLLILKNRNRDDNNLISNIVNKQTKIVD